MPRSTSKELYHPNIRRKFHALCLRGGALSLGNNQIQIQIQIQTLLSLSLSEANIPSTQNKACPRSIGGAKLKISPNLWRVHVSFPSETKV